MTLKVLFFSLLRDLVPEDEMTVEIREGATVGDLLRQLQEEYPALKSWEGRLLMAAEHEYVKGDFVLSDGQEVAFMPPVQGG